MMYKKFGRLLVIEKSKPNKYRQSMWLCKCDCGNEKIVSSNSLKRGLTTSCGCYQKEQTFNRQFKNLIGQKFNRLLVVEYSHQDNRKSAIWRCLCDCGNIKLVRGDCLRSGKIKSCGCYKTDKAYFGTKDINGSYFCSLIHSAKKRNLEFKLTIEYLQQLLEDQDYKCKLSGLDIYGCKSHSSQQQTISLDRINSNFGYIEGNVQWVHKDINFAKQSKTDTDFIQMCIQVANYQLNRGNYIDKTTEETILNEALQSVEENNIQSG